MDSFINTKTLAVGGGKGGVGKSFIASNLACSIALQGHKVVLIDADLAGANIHTLFGIKVPEKTLNDFLKKRVEQFSDILLPTPLENLHLICGASEFLEIANPNYAQKQKLIRAMSKLGADYTIIDIGAGANLNNLDFFNMADVGIIATSPSPTAIQNSYAFLKLAVSRKLVTLFSSRSNIKKEIANALGGSGEITNIIEILNIARKEDKAFCDLMMKALVDIQSRLIVNMATEQEAEKVSKAMADAAYQFLRIRLHYLGHIDFDRNVEQSIREMKPLMLGQENSLSSAINRIAEQITGEDLL